MKQLLHLFFLPLFLLGITQQDSFAQTISVGAIEGCPGETVLVPITGEDFPTAFASAQVRFIFSEEWGELDLAVVPADLPDGYFHYDDYRFSFLWTDPFCVTNLGSNFTLLYWEIQIPEDAVGCISITPVVSYTEFGTCQGNVIPVTTNGGVICMSNNCTENCCGLVPDINNLSIVYTSGDLYEVCFEECEDIEYVYQYRPVGSPWIYGAFCDFIHLDPCETYEFQVEGWSDECGQILYSDLLLFTPQHGCQTPDANDLTFQYQPSMVSVCLNTENCPNDMYYFQYRESGTTSWIDAGGTTNSCVDLSLSDCVSYDFRVAIDSENCGLTDYSTVISFTPGSNCGDCCDISPSLVYRRGGCNRVRVCMRGYEDCETTYKYFYKVTSTDGTWTSGNNNWIPVPNSEFTANCYTFTDLDPCNSYRILVIASPPNCDEVQQTIDIRFPRFCCDPLHQEDNTARTTATGQTFTQSKEVVTKTAAPLVTNVYPNPFTTQLSLDVSTTQAERYRLAIFDTQGRMLQSQEGQVQKGMNTIQVKQASELTRGIYFYRLNIGNELMTHKIVKE